MSKTALSTVVKDRFSSLCEIRPRVNKRLERPEIVPHMANTPFKHNLSIRRNWLLGGFTAEYALTCSYVAPQLSDLVDAVLTSIHDYLPQPHTIDCKGRNHYDTIVAGIPGEAEGEVFRIGGEIASSTTGAEFEWSPFEASCGSVFREFEGTHHISYNLHHHRSTTLPDWLPWWLLGAAAPIRPRYFRVGLERFQSRFTWASFGYLPQVTDSFLLDAVDSTLAIRLVVERQAWRPTDPFSEFPIFGGIAAAARQAMSLDIRSTFRSELLRVGKI